MRLTKIILPEILLGLRGQPEVIKYYTEWTDLFVKQGSSWAMKTNPEIRSQLQQMSAHDKNHLLMARMYKERLPKNYYIGSDFSEAISQHKSDIPLDLLPERFFAFIQFPEKKIYNETNDEVEGAFVYVGPSTEVPADQIKGYNRVFFASWKYKSADLKTDSTLTSLDDVTTIKQAFDELGYRLGKGENENWNRKIPTLLANLVLYITKADPDLLPMRSKDNSTDRERKESEANHGVSNLCEVPLVLVSWNWQKPLAFSMDETTVRGHWKWQRYGEGNQKLKFIFINDHVRTFTNVTGSISAE